MIQCYFRILSISFISVISQLAEANNYRGYFQNFVIANHRIILLHADGLITAYDDKSGRSIKFNYPKEKVKLILKDHNNSVIIVDLHNNVCRLEPDDKWATIFSYSEGEIFNAAFNTNNDCFLITNKGIVNSKNGLTYTPDKKLGNSEYSYKGGNPFESKDHKIDYFMDLDGYLWVSFDHGEWGADIFIFNTITNCFSSQKSIGIIPNHQINNQLIAVVNVFSLKTFILRFDQINQDKISGNFKGKIIYKSEADPTVPDFLNTGKRFLFEALSYNQNDKYCYVITSYGLFKIAQINEIKEFKDLIPILEFSFPSEQNVWIDYYDNQKHEFMPDKHISKPPFISKIEFTENNKIVMLAPFNGLWLFDLKKLKILE